MPISDWIFLTGIVAVCHQFLEDEMLQGVTEQLGFGLDVLPFEEKVHDSQVEIVEFG